MFLKNKKFFDSPAPADDEAEQTAENVVSAAWEEETEEAESRRDFSFYDTSIMEQLQKLEEYCRDAKRRDLLSQIDSVKEYLSSNKFTVAVVGEFNRGKSTLVNRLIEKDIIPTSDIPTTIAPIRISGGRQESISVYNGSEKKTYPLKKESWEAAEKELKLNKGPKGEIFLKRNCSLLTEHDLEIIDTPGVNSQIKGDLTMAEQALNVCDCAILTMAAVSAFGESERLFLQERIITKKIPRIMVVITKLDLVEEKQRSSVMELVKAKLSAFNEDIPLYISSEGLLEGWEEKSGTNVIIGQILRWMQEASHVSLKKERAYQGIRSIASDLEAVYNCQLEVMAEKEEKRKDAAELKKQQLLRSSQIQWDTLEIDMIKRCNQNFEWIRSMTDERQQDIIEKLILELNHVPSPKDWWENDYPYRIKMEMISLANIMENNLQAFYTRDVNWLNHMLHEKYGSVIPPQNQRIADKDIFRSLMTGEKVELEDIKRTRLISRIGTGAATIGGYLIGGLIGLSPLGMIVGVGGGVVSEIFMNKRVEAQKQSLSKIIREQFPIILSERIATVENNIRNVYIATIHQMKQSCSDWVKVKCEAIDKAQEQTGKPEQTESIKQKIAELKQLGINK